MSIEIKEITPEFIEEYEVKEFIFSMIKSSYNLDYVPEYHYDVMNLEKYYIEPERNMLYLAIDTDKNELIGTSAIRSFERKSIIENKDYDSQRTASLYRLFVKEEYRHNGIATKLINKIEDFCINKGYSEIYLHTQKDSYGALPFWLNKEYEITYDTHDELGTIHMEKIIASK